MSRIKIDDLPVAENLTPEQEELIEGAGLKSFRPTLEDLERREMMDAGIGGALATAPPPAGPSHVRTLEAAQPTRVEMPAATLLGNVQTLKGGFDQSGNLIPGTTDASAAAV